VPPMNPIEARKKKPSVHSSICKRKLNSGNNITQTERPTCMILT
jgi:hypothetical protein